MKKRTIILIAVGVMLCVVICIGLFIVQNEKRKPIFLIESSMSGLATDDEFKDFKEASAYGVSTDREKVKLEDVEREKSPLFDQNTEYSYEESECCLKTVNEGEYGNFYSIYDVYESEDEKKEVEYLHNTDIMTWYVDNTKSFHEIGNGNASEEEAKYIADEFLINLLSKEALNKYTYVGLYSKMDDKSVKYEFLYRRYIEGYPTDEYIFVDVGKNGDVVFYCAPNLQKYDTLIDSISKEKLDEAKNLLEKKIGEANVSEDVAIKYTGITTNTSGELFLMMTVEGQYSGCRFMISIE